MGVTDLSFGFEDFPLLICERCEKKHYGGYGSGRFCDSICAHRIPDESKEKMVKTARANRKKNTVTVYGRCEKCCNFFTELLPPRKKKATKRFCSRSCANSRTHSEETKQKTRETLLKKHHQGVEVVKGEGRKEIILGPRSDLSGHNCQVCKRFFLGSKGRRFCSRVCSSEVADYSNSGGYREGSGRSKSGYYKGVYCGSTYELCWVIYSLDHGDPVSRFPGSLTSGCVTYFPDFLMEDEKTIIEIKGYEEKDKTEAKKRVAEGHGFTVIILYREDLKEIFDYVFSKYGTNKFYELYDGYKPRFTFNCKMCGSEFQRDKAESTYCSRSCSGRAANIRKYS